MRVVLTLRGPDQATELRSLRWCLKALLRRFAVTCISAVEAPPIEPVASQGPCVTSLKRDAE